MSRPKECHQPLLIPLPGSQERESSWPAWVRGPPWSLQIWPGGPRPLGQTDTAAGAQLGLGCSWGGGQLSHVLEENEDPFSIRRRGWLLPGLQEGGLGGLPGRLLEVDGERTFCRATRTPWSLESALKSPWLLWLP